jgi:hypothetical protein
MTQWKRLTRADGHGEVWVNLERATVLSNHDTYAHVVFDKDHSRSVKEAPEEILNQRAIS